MPIPACFPLPLYTMTAALAQRASRLGVPAVERPCTTLLFDHFSELAPQKPVWEAHPADRLRQRDRHVRSASRPLLRAYARTALLHSERQLAALASAPPLDTAQPYAGAQTRRLLLVKRVVLAMQVRSATHCRDRALLRPYPLCRSGVVATLQPSCACRQPCLRATSL